MTSPIPKKSADAGKRGNIFAGIPEKLPEELCESLLQNDSVRIERIVSLGHATAPDSWYDQQWDEWVVLLQGAAILSFDGDGVPLAMAAGDYVFIPAHRKHRVEWTDPRQESVWLAIHVACGETP